MTSAVLPVELCPKRDYHLSMRNAVFILAVAALVIPRELIAGNSRSFFLGDEAALTGGAGIAVSADSGSLWYNPAGLGGLTLGRMELTGTVYSAKLRGLDDILVTRIPSGKYTADARADDFGSVPTSLVFVRNGNEKISYGAAWYQTRDSWLDFRADMQEPYDTEGRVWSEGVEYHQRAYVYHIGPSIGIALTPRLKIGASLYFVYTNFNASLRAFLGITDPDADPPTDTIVAVSEQYSEMSLGFMVAAGLQLQLSNRWHMGVVLRTPTFQVWESVDGSSLDSETAASETEFFSDFNYTTEEDTRFVFEQTVPMEAQFGVVYRNGDNWIGAEAAVRPPLEAMDQTLLWNASIGGRMALTSIVSFGAGIFTDNSSTEKGAVGSLDWKSDRYGFTTGLEFKTPLIVKGSPEKEGEEKKERSLTWTTTIALSYSFEFAEYNTFDVNSEHTEILTLPRKDGVFHQGFVYLGTALYF